MLKMSSFQAHRILYLLLVYSYVGDTTLSEPVETKHSTESRSNIGRGQHDVRSTSTRFDCESLSETRHETEFASFGNTLLKAKKFNEATLCYTAAIEKNAFKASYYRRRGYCHSRTGHADRAQQDFEKAVQLDPENALGRTFLNEALFDSEKFDELLERIRNLNYGLTLLAALADQLYEEEKFEYALPYYTELITKHPENSIYYHRQRRCNQARGKLMKTIFDYQKSVNTDPQNVAYKIDLTEAFIEDPEFTEAKNVLKKIDINNLRESGAVRLATIRQKEKDSKKRKQKRDKKRPMVPSR